MKSFENVFKGLIALVWKGFAIYRSRMGSADLEWFNNGRDFNGFIMAV